jgi:hypothetical protein
MFKLLKKLPYWYLIAIPLLSLGLGAASNQAVLIANGDKFPVMVNAEKIHKACAPAIDADPLSALIRNIMHTETAKDPDPNSCTNGGVFLDGVHTIMQPKDHLKFLADIFDLGSIYSIGDFGIILGSWMWDWSLSAWVVLVLRKFIEA